MSLSWETLVINLKDNSVKQRLLGGEALLELAGHSSLSLDQFAEFVDLCSALLQDSSFKVAQQTLHALSLLVCREPDSIRPYANSIVPLIAERLGDARQQVRQDACVVLLRLLSVLRPDSVIPKLARFWTHRNWKVRHGLLQTMAEAVSKSIPGMIPPNMATASPKEQEQVNYVITQVVNLVEDPNEAVRDASLDCLQELYRSLDSSLVENLRRQNIRHAALKEVVARLDQIKPCNLIPLPSSDVNVNGFSRSSSRAGTDGEGDGTVKVDVQGSAMKASKKINPGPTPVEESTPFIRIHNEKELAQEVEASLPLISSLVPEWTKRVQALTRLEGVALGIHSIASQPQALLDALNEASKQLRDPLARQVEDRRSAVQKQACQTINALALTLGSRFQDHAVFLLPEVIKVLPVSVLIMAQSADKCCQSLIATCPSYRMLSVFIHAATKDKNPKIRALCCGYVAFAVERWDWSSLSKCADDIEGTMRAAAQDANGEARQASKRLYLAYSSKAPVDTFNSFVNKLDSSIKEKLSKGVVSGGGGAEGGGGGGGEGGGGEGGAKGRGLALSQQSSGLPAPPSARTSRSPLANAKALALASKKSGGADVLNEVVIFAPPPPSAQQKKVPVHTFSTPAPVPAPAPYHATTFIATSSVSNMAPVAMASAAAAEAPVFPPTSSGLPPRATAHPPFPVPLPRPRASTAHDLPSAPLVPPPLASQSSAGSSVGSLGSGSIGLGMSTMMMKAGRKSLGGINSLGPARVPCPDPSSYSSSSSSFNPGTMNKAEGQSAATLSSSSSSTAAPNGTLLDMANLVHALTLNDLSQRQQPLTNAGGAGGGYQGMKPSRRSTGMMGLTLMSGSGGGAGGGMAGTALPFPNSQAMAIASSTSSAAAVRVPAPAPAPAIVPPPALSQAPPPPSSLAPHPAAHPALLAPVAAPSARQMISRTSSDLLSGSSSSWSERVEGMTALMGLLSTLAGGEEGSEDGGGGRDQHPRSITASSAMSQPPSSLLPLELCKEMERLVPRVTEWIDDPHQKVSHAALDLFHIFIKLCPRSIADASPSQIDKAMPVLFQKAAASTVIVAWSASGTSAPHVAGGGQEGHGGGGGREGVKAKAVLVELLSSFPSDLLLGPLVKSLEACKLPRAKALVMEAAVHHVGVNKPSGPPSLPSLVKQWLKGTTLLLGDKSPDIRKAALGAVEAMYNGSWGDACISLLSTFLAHSASGQEAVALKRALQTLQDKTLPASGHLPPPQQQQQQQQMALSRSKAQPVHDAMNVDDDTMQVEIVPPMTTAAATREPGAGAAAYSASEYTSPMRFAPTAMEVDIPIVASFGSSSFGGSSSSVVPTLPSPSSVSDVTGFTFAPSEQSTKKAAAPQVPLSAAAAAFLKMEPQAAARHVSLLAHRLLLSSSSSQPAPSSSLPSAQDASSQVLESLAKLSDILKAAPALACEALGPQLTLQLAKATAKIAGNTSGPSAAREAAVQLSVALLTSTMSLEASHTVRSSSNSVQEAAVLGLLEAASDASSKDFARVSFESLGSLLTRCIPLERSIDLLVPHLPQPSQLESVDPNYLQAVVRSLTSVIGELRVSKDHRWLIQSQGPAVLSRVVPGLVTSLLHSRADVRKAVVFCMVEVWLWARVEAQARAAMEGHLSPMTEAQKKLVEIYVQRAEKN